MVATEEGTKLQTDTSPVANPVGKANRGQPKSGKRGQETGDAQVGRVLQNVYQQTIEEDIPSEMLDLLNKLN